MTQKSNNTFPHPSTTYKYSSDLHSNQESIYNNKYFVSDEYENKENPRLLGLWPVVYANDTDIDWDKDDEKRWEKIFKRLDRNGNGRIDIQDLMAVLNDSGMSRHYAEVLCANKNTF